MIANASAARLNRPRALIFDWDNTLVDTWPTIHDALNHTLAAMGHTPWSLEESKERVRLSLRDSFPKLFGTRWEEARQIYLTAFLAMHLDRLAVLPGIVELIEHLSGAGFYLAVVSNKTGPILRREAERLEWSRHFKRLVGATDATADKPDAAPVLMALEGSQIPAGRDVWFVGDTAVDMECAVNAGCVPVLLGPADPAGGEFAVHKPELAFQDGGALFLHMRTL
jgi:phosphoglycolate phosphatase